VELAQLQIVRQSIPLRTKKLRRSVSDCWIGGVCGGLAEYFGMDPTVVRVGYVLLSILSIAFPGILVYLIMWALIPERE
jgi:phage shock protein C